MDAICGGVISETKFWEEPDAYMMMFVMPDKVFEKYRKLKPRTKEAEQLFRAFARSYI